MEDKSQSIFAVAGTFLAISWIIVILRCYVRLTLTRWGVDDLTMVVTLVCWAVHVQIHCRVVCGWKQWPRLSLCLANSPLITLQLLFSAFVSSLIFSTTNGLGKHDKAITNRNTVMNAFKVGYTNLSAAQHSLEDIVNS